MNWCWGESVISCDSKTERGALLTPRCVKQKRTGELCWWVIRALGYTDNRFLNVLLKEDKGALFLFLRRRGDNSHHGCFVMCPVLICSLASKWDRSHLKTSDCLSLCSPPSPLSSTCSLVIKLHLHSLSFLQTSISSVTSLARTACAKWRCYWGDAEFTL